MDLIEFVRARLDEREALAKQATTVGGKLWHRGPVEHDQVLISETGHRIIIGAGSALPHIAANDPAHVLRDIAAKRAIVDSYAADPNIRSRGGVGGVYGVGRNQGFAYAVECIAAIDADRPDYNPSWRPT